MIGVAASGDARRLRAAEALADDAELLRRYHRLREPAVRQELVHRYLPFARKMALRYRGAEPTEDLIQVASLGLLGAIERFDPDRGTPFVAFAMPTILGELRRHFRDRVWNLRLPRGLQERASRVDEAITKLTGGLEHSPTVREIASYLELSEDDVLEALAAAEARWTVSLDQPYAGPDSDETPIGERLGDEEAGFELVELRTTFVAGLPALSERQRLVLRLRFVDDLTQSQIAERIGVSQMQISRILRATLARLREAVESGPWGEAEVVDPALGPSGSR
ncbi:MAG TPA: SigB/SigF/SigG family RNA polymerase sigma factor [Solirubrobacterales bacterium]|jgi:RNA polymerase sigma-B factor